MIAIYLGIRSLSVSKKILSDNIYIQKIGLIKKYLYYQIVLGLISIIPFTLGIMILIYSDQDEIFNPYRISKIS